MTSWDGTTLFYRAWLPAAATDRALLLFRRGHEHSGRWEEVVERLDLEYLLETIHSLAPLPVSALLRDKGRENIEAGRRLARDLGLADVVFQEGDAFDRAALAGIRPRPTLAVVSGLYELFPENAPLLESLRGLADAVEPGGYLVYTNQPYHPQLEFIARVLINREGRPWIMRRRTQAEMDELVRSVGFEKLGMEIDPWGIFTVSTARRRPGRPP